MTPITQRWIPILLPGVLASLLIAQILLTSSVPDNQDLLRYFESSDWAVGRGRLYVSTFSEYPLLANLMFALVRSLSVLAGDSFAGFSVIWILLAAITTAYSIRVMLHFVQVRFPSRNLWIPALAWLSPGVLFFALMRYDIYPALATLLMLICLNGGHTWRAALWLGVAICLKGYAIIFFPAIGIYLRGQIGINGTLRFCMLALTLPMLSLLAVLVYADMTAMLSPFRFHATRSYNADSLYLLVDFMTGFNLNNPSWDWLPKLLQLFCVLFPLWLRPVSFNGLVETMTCVLAGVLTFSVFYSPQFVLWLLPLGSLSASTRTTMLTLLYTLATTGYFLVAGHPTAAALLILIATLGLLRLCLLVGTWRSSIAYRNS